MNLYLIVSRGRRADEAQPVLAISDQWLIHQFLANVGTLLLPQAREEHADKVVDVPRPRGYRGEHDNE